MVISTGSKFNIVYPKPKDDEASTQFWELTTTKRVFVRTMIRDWHRVDGTHTQLCSAPTV